MGLLPIFNCYHTLVQTDLMSQNPSEWKNPKAWTSAA